MMLAFGIGFDACGLPTPLPPLCVASFYAISSIEDAFWTTKQRPVSYFPMVIQYKEVAHYLDPSLPTQTSTPAHTERSLLYHYMIQEWLGLSFNDPC